MRHDLRSGTPEQRVVILQHRVSAVGPLHHDPVAAVRHNLVAVVVQKRPDSETAKREQSELLEVRQAAVVVIVIVVVVAVEQRAKLLVARAAVVLGDPLGAIGRAPGIACRLACILRRVGRCVGGFLAVLLALERTGKGLPRLFAVGATRTVAVGFIVGGIAVLTVAFGSIAVPVALPVFGILTVPRAITGSTRRTVALARPGVPVCIPVPAIAVGAVALGVLGCACRPIAIVFEKPPAKFVGVRAISIGSTSLIRGPAPIAALCTPVSAIIANARCAICRTITIARAGAVVRTILAGRAIGPALAVGRGIPFLGVETTIGALFIATLFRLAGPTSGLGIRGAIGPSFIAIRIALGVPRAVGTVLGRAPIGRVSALALARTLRTIAVLLSLAVRRAICLVAILLPAALGGRALLALLLRSGLAALALGRALLRVLGATSLTAFLGHEGKRLEGRQCHRQRGRGRQQTALHRKFLSLPVRLPAPDHSCG
ncbi:hypothetical protein [Rhodobacter sp. NSM]|uniref:hypothetical protein n=1 Tax=Rhodobacter sp. NSM TaxID=3457501 RepID=UPI003FD5CDA8